MRNQHLQNTIDRASGLIGKSWPLYSFVTSNPLSGYENQPFTRAVEQARTLLGANVLPEGSFFRNAYENGEIDRHLIADLLQNNGFKMSPEETLSLMEKDEKQQLENPFHDLDRLTVKWLAAFMDEGLAEWSMPGKEMGFYRAWRQIAKYDSELKGRKAVTLPGSALEAIAAVLEEHPKADPLRIFTLHLAALPGWTGYIKFRMETQTAWQQHYPVTFADYLAVRLSIARLLSIPVLPEGLPQEAGKEADPLRYTWLTAWERSWQEALLDELEISRANKARTQTPAAPDAQMVFCIDTRSEAIRRHVEAQGAYETFGYAGFFGIAMDYTDPATGLSRKSCPPILGSAYTVNEKPAEDQGAAYRRFEKYNEIGRFARYFQKRMKNMLPSTFGYVEGSGVSYGLALMARTIFPGFYYRNIKKQEPVHEHLCEPVIGKVNAGQAEGIPLPERVAIVKSAFDLMGWRTFAPLVIFTGHGSHSANNPFASSLDCGACAASPGRQNARMLAKLANMPEVRKALLDLYGIIIPESTWFMGGEHNTTTDHIVLFDSETPPTHKKLVARVKSDLEKARITATRERLQLINGSVEAAEERAGNWSETRPEWGLAKNAGFIIAPRTTTSDLHLGGRCFLHSYDWEKDPEGKALEAIMQGPMVVTQWINNHYFFTSVDPEHFGSGSKITQNITGMFGVVQGNGGDLKAGLPLQSLRISDTEMYHQPLRLSVVIEAPRERVTAILERNKALQELLDNQWIHLLVNDPSRDYRAFRYTKDLLWYPEEKQVAANNTQKVTPKEQQMSI